MKNKIKVCVCRNVVFNGNGKKVTGVFTWRGPNWISAQIVGLVKELPTTISDKDLNGEYRAASKAMKAGAIDVAAAAARLPS